MLKRKKIIKYIKILFVIILIIISIFLLQFLKKIYLYNSKSIKIYFTFNNNNIINNIIIEEPLIYEKKTDHIVIKYKDIKKSKKVKIIINSDLLNLKNNYKDQVSFEFKIFNMSYKNTKIDINILFDNNFKNKNEMIVERIYYDIEESKIYTQYDYFDSKNIKDTLILRE